ncbi:MAG TPA: MFS transporter [Candidatus Saccharimonadales bacterium]|nr:MFS transporter [Candidatus Saccharimonadales bacterium]
MISRIGKIYISNFLTGLVFWYGIEKLFMDSIGIDAVGVSIATALFLGFILVLDIPSGILADKWSRKGMLVVSAIALALCSLILGSSNGLMLYILGYIFYGIYVVSTSGTYQAITYDILHEEKRANQYSKIMGRAYALFLAGAGVANIASGFIAVHSSYRMAFFITIASCILNVLVLLTLKEPTFHKAEAKAKVLRQLGQATKALANIKLLRALAIILSALAVVELFKGEFGQLYMLRYVSEPQIIGLLWAAYAFTWALGSLIAHKFRARLTTLIVATTLPLILMAFTDNAISLALFMVQAVASAALINQIETRIQENTPSSVRASILSVLSALGRAISIPASLFLGWLFTQYNALWALRFVAGVAVIILIYWFWTNKNIARADKSEMATTQVSL